MSSPKDITHCFAFDKVSKNRQRKRDLFFKITYFILAVLFGAQIVFFFI